MNPYLKTHTVCTCCADRAEPCSENGVCLGSTLAANSTELIQQSQQQVFDFNGIPGLIKVKPGGVLSLINLQLHNVAYKTAYVHSQAQPYISEGMGAGLWPSIQFAPNSTVSKGPAYAAQGLHAGCKMRCCCQKQLWQDSAHAGCCQNLGPIISNNRKSLWIAASESALQIMYVAAGSCAASTGICGSLYYCVLPPASSKGHLFELGFFRGTGVHDSCARYKALVGLGGLHLLAWPVLVLCVRGVCGWFCCNNERMVLM